MARPVDLQSSVLSVYYGCPLGIQPYSRIIDDSSPNLILPHGSQKTALNRKLSQKYSYTPIAQKVLHLPNHPMLTPQQAGYLHASQQ